MNLKKCRVCDIELNDVNWYPSQKKLDNYICKDCHNKKCKKNLNKEKVNEYAKRYREKNPNYYREYRANNLDKEIQRHKQEREKLKLIVYNHYTNNDIKCSCCGEQNIKFLSIDHINNDGAKHRKEIGTGDAIYRWPIKNNFPGGYRILCMNCNYGRKMNNGKCPHEEG